MNMNLAIVVGEIVEEPKIRQVGDTNVVRITLKNSADDFDNYFKIEKWVKKTKFYDFLRVGDHIAVSGSISTSKYEKNGNIVYETVIKADTVEKIK